MLTATTLGTPMELRKVTDQPKKLLLAGDWHGNTHFASKVFERAVERKADAIFQLGDFGYWEHDRSGVEYLTALETFVQHYGVPLYWLDGNHENHPLLRHNYGPPDADCTVINDEFWKVRDGIMYSPRGHRFTWHGVTFMTVGGAFSIDKARRIWGDSDYPFYGSYWPEEMITVPEEEFAKRMDGGPKVNVILSHDAPELPMEGVYGTSGWKVDANSEASRQAIRRIVEATGPRQLFHGHYHAAYTSVYEYNGGFRTKIRGLDADVNYDVNNATQFVGLSDGFAHEAN